MSSPSIEFYKQNGYVKDSENNKIYNVEFQTSAKTIYNENPYNLKTLILLSIYSLGSIKKPENEYDVIKKNNNYKNKRHRCKYTRYPH